MSKARKKKTPPKRDPAPASSAAPASTGKPTPIVPPPAPVAPTAPNMPSEGALAATAAKVRESKPRGRAAVQIREREAAERTAQDHATTCQLLAIHGTNSINTSLGFLDRHYSKAIEALEAEDPNLEVTLQFREDEHLLVQQTLEGAVSKASPEWLDRWGPTLFLAGTILSVGIPKILLCMELGAMQRDILEDEHNTRILQGVDKTAKSDAA